MAAEYIVARQATGDQEEEKIKQVQVTHRLKGPQTLQAGLIRIEAKADGNALHDFYVVAGGVLRRQDA